MPQCVVDHVIQTVYYGNRNGTELGKKIRQIEANRIIKMRLWETLKPYISAPTSRRMMPLVPKETTSQKLSFEPPLT